MSISGECFCGGVKYEVQGALSDARSCHCSRCRKVFGGAASAYAEVEAGKFSWVAGQEKLTVYESAPGWGLYFCGVCGSTLGGVHEGQVHGVALGSVNGDPGVTLQRHIFVGSKAPWDEIGGDTPQYDEAPPKGIQ